MKRPLDSNDVREELPDDVWILILLDTYHCSNREESFARLWSWTRLFFPLSYAQIFMQRIVPALLWLPTRTKGFSAELLRQCRSLASLNVYHHTALEREDIQQLTNLVSLALFTPRVDLDTMLSLPKLRRLEAGYSTRIKDSELRQLTQLEDLSIHFHDMRGLALEDTPMCHPDSFTALIAFLENETLIDEGLACLTRLERLEVSMNTRLTGESFSVLSNLTELSMHKCSSVHTTKLATLTQLRVLGLHDYVRMPWYELEHLSTLTSLQHLSIATEREAEVVPLARTQWPNTHIEYSDWLFGL